MNLDRIRQALSGRSSAAWLAGMAFVNSFLLPTPAETLLVPMCVANPNKSWWYASVATVASVSGGLFGYVIGAIAFNAIGSHIIDLYGTQQEFDTLINEFNRSGAEWILLATVSPLPYKMVTITSGVSGMNVLIFLSASLLGRVIGYFSIAAICWRFGDQASKIITSYTGKVASVLILCGVGYVLIFA